MSTPNRIGTDRSIMEASCANVRSYTQEVNTLIEDLTRLNNSLPQYWEGDNLELFTSEFVKFQDKLSQLPEVLAELINVADDTSLRYQNIVEKSAQGFSEILGGMR